MSKQVKVGSITTKIPYGYIGFVDKQGKAKAVPAKWNTEVKDRRRISLGGELEEERRNDSLYYIKGMGIWRTKRSKRSRGISGK